MRYTIADEIGAVMGPLVVAHVSPHGPAPKLSERMLFEALLSVAMTVTPGCEGIGRVFADSTIVRAHQHSAGARKKKTRHRVLRPSAAPAAA